MRFCLQLYKLKHIHREECERLIWFKRDLQIQAMCQLNYQSPIYLNEVFDVAAESNLKLKGSFRKLKCPFRKTNNSQFPFFYIGPIFLNKTPKTLKCGNNLNNFKHNLKIDFLDELKTNPF